MGDLLELADRVEKGVGADNALDVLVEIALFTPDAEDASVRANSAGSKVIYTDRHGSDYTCRAFDWTLDRPRTAAALRARASLEDRDAPTSPYPPIRG